MAIIEVQNLTKEFQLGQFRSLKQTLLGTAGRLMGRPVERTRRFNALSDVSFSVEPGEVLGIIGENGAGKSTLLKLLAGISRPTSGSIRVNGRVAPLIEVGAGLIGDLTGRENIYLNGSILGLSRETIRAKFDEIVAFAELEEFIDTPVKRYSSGMQVRLGFSIATIVDAEILIVDEVLAVGDLAFQRKCFDRMENMIKNQGRTVLFVSHNLRQVERICSRTILLDHGKVLADGPSSEVCNLFYERSDERVQSTTASRRELHETGDVELVDVSLVDAEGSKTDSIEYGDSLNLAIVYKANTELEKPHFGIGIHTTDFLYLATHITEDQFTDTTLGPGVHKIHCSIVAFPFLPGVYSIRLGMSVGDMTVPVFYAENVLSFQVTLKSGLRSQAMQEGFVELNARWNLETSARNDNFLLPEGKKSVAG